MSARRSRLQIRPNIGPKLGKGPSQTVKSGTVKTGPVAAKKQTIPTEQEEPAGNAVATCEASAPVDPVQNGSRVEGENETSKIIRNVEIETNKTVDKMADKLSKDKSGSGEIPADAEVQSNKEQTGDVEKMQSNEEQTGDVDKMQSNKEQTGDVEKMQSNKEQTGDVEKMQSNKEQTGDVENLKSNKEQTGDVKKVQSKPKVRSRFPKAKPNLADISRPKSKNTASKPDLSKADSEKETRKEAIFDSVDSDKLAEKQTTVLTSVTSETTEVVQSPPVTVRSDVANPTVVEKSVEVLVEKHQSHKAEERRHSTRPEGTVSKVKKHRSLPPVDQPPDRGRMRMKDLIYWNPISNLMTPPVKKKTGTPSVTPRHEEVSSPMATEEENQADAPDSASEDSNSMPVPQVKIGPDGSIILNEESLVIENNKNEDIRPELEVIEETDSCINYNSFRAKTSTKNWSKKETAKFYKALSSVGTDFSLMMNLFPHRTRREIKNKFKREEKYNHILIDKAIKEREAFDMAIFEKFEREREEERKEKERKEKEKLASRKRKRKPVEESEKKDKEARKENRARGHPKRKRSRRKKLDFDDDMDSEIEDTLETRVVSTCSRADRENPVASQNVEEVVEILVSMSRGEVPKQARNDETESARPETDDVFLPLEHLNVKTDTPFSAIEEDSTVDFKVESGPDSVYSHPTTDSSHSSVQDTVAQGMQEIEIPAGILPQFQDGSGDGSGDGSKKMHVVLVPEQSSPQGSTVIHVYVLPETLNNVNIGSNTVLLSPTHSSEVVMPPVSSPSGRFLNSSNVQSVASSATSVFRISPSSPSVHSPGVSTSASLLSQRSPSKVTSFTASPGHSSSPRPCQESTVKLLAQKLTSSSSDTNTAHSFSDVQCSATQKKSVLSESPLCGFTEPEQAEKNNRLPSDVDAGNNTCVHEQEMCGSGSRTSGKSDLS